MSTESFTYIDGNITVTVECDSTTRNLISIKMAEKFINHKEIYDINTHPELSVMYDECIVTTHKVGVPIIKLLNGVVVVEEYRVSGQRENNKPHTIVYYPSGELFAEIWPAGVSDTPTIIIYDKDGKIEKQEWHNSIGDPYRLNDKPAIIECGEFITRYKWYDQCGRISRENGKPAIKERENGITIRKLWYSHGMLHREHDKPTIEIYKNGEIVCQKWYNRDGDLHRKNGLPAVVSLDGEEYYFNGKQYTPPVPTAEDIAHQYKILETMLKRHMLAKK